MNYFLGGISLILAGSYNIRAFNSNRNIEHYAAAFYFAAAIVCFVLY